MVIRGLQVSMVLGVLVLAGCGAHDRSGNLTKEDYKELLEPPKRAEQRREAPPIPDLQPILAAPVPTATETRMVSISVTEDTPLKDVLAELARKAGVDLELDPGIEGGVFFTARERPFAQVIERLADLAGLRYTFKDNVLRVEVDRKYHQNYRVEALNMVRTSTSQVSTTTNILSDVPGSTSSGNNASTSSISNTTEANLWKEITAGVTQILENSDSQAKPRVAAAAPAAQPAAAAQAAQAAQPAAPANAATASAGAGGTGVGAQAAQLQQQLQQAQQAIQDVPAQARAQAAQPAAEAAAPAATKGQGASWFSSNQQAGLVSVYGTAKQHKLVKEYLDQILQMVSAQVLIEAKVVEVTLTDQFRSGIDWTVVTNLAGSKFTLGLPLPAVALDGTALPAFTLGRVDKTGTEQSLLELVKTFGTVRTLSSPRLTVTNNQTAVLKVARNVVYFEINVTPGTTTSTGTTPATYSSEMRTVPEGVILTVQPSINLKREEVTLGLRPTITRVVGFKDDPAVRLAGSTEPSPVPEVEVREMDSVVTMSSGEVVVMGGLMQERATAETTGIPGVMDVPLVGYLARRQSDLTELVELVVIIKATILKNARDSVQPQDRKLYDRFGLDPRPMAF